MDKQYFAISLNLGHTPKSNLSSVLQCNDNITPLTHKSRHHLHVLDHIVREIAPVPIRPARDNLHPKVCEPVSQVKSP
ncbi:hypothetical protein SLE2022_335090 [Rubroshorea leprosula]